MTAIRLCKAITLVFFVWLVTSLSGCLYLPKFGERVSESDIAFLEMAPVTRQEVFRKLGVPNILNSTNFAIYQWRTTRSRILIGSTHGGDRIELSRISSRLLVEFDQTGGLTAYTYSRSTVPPIFITYDGKTRTQPDLSKRVSYDRIVTTSFCGKSSFKNWCTSFDLSPDGSMIAIAATHKNNLTLLNVATGENRSLQGESAVLTRRGLYNVRFSPNGTFVGAAGVDDVNSSNIVVVWNVLSGMPVFAREVSGKAHFIWRTKKGAVTLAFSPDGKILSTGSENGVIQFWDVMSGREIASVKIADAPIQSIAWSPGAELLAVGTTRGALIVTRSNGRESAVLIPDSKLFRYGRNVLFAPDSGTLLTNNCINIDVWSIRELRALLGKIAGQNTTTALLTPKAARLLPYGFQDSDSCLPSLSLSRDGNILAALSSNHMITLWNRRHNRLIAVLNASKNKNARSSFFTGHHKDLTVKELALSGDGSLVVTTEFRGGPALILPRIKFWNVNK